MDLKHGLLTEECAECHKKITDDEWVTNWCSCDECFSTQLDKFIQEVPDGS